MYIISQEFLYEKPLVFGFYTPKAVGDNLYVRRTLGSEKISAEDVPRTAAGRRHGDVRTDDSRRRETRRRNVHTRARPHRTISSRRRTIVRNAQRYRTAAAVSFCFVGHRDRTSRTVVSFFFRQFDYTTYAAYVFRTTFRISYNDDDYYVVHSALCSRVGALGGRCIPVPCVCGALIKRFVKFSRKSSGDQTVAEHVSARQWRTGRSRKTGPYSSEFALQHYVR